MQRIGVENINEMKQLEKSLILAGLCHDLGHGPISHCWDDFLMKLVGFYIDSLSNSIKARLINTARRIILSSFRCFARQ